MFISRKQVELLRKNNNELTQAMRELADLVGYTRQRRVVINWEYNPYGPDKEVATIEWYWEKKEGEVEFVTNSWGNLDMRAVAKKAAESIKRKYTKTGKYKKKGKYTKRSDYWNKKGLTETF